jgi:hypothetical protein
MIYFIIIIVIVVIIIIIIITIIIIFTLNHHSCLISAKRFHQGMSMVKCVLSFNSDHPGASASLVPGCGKRFGGERAIQDQPCFTSLDHRPKAIKARSIRIYH